MRQPEGRATLAAVSDLVFLDTETTGLSPIRDRIVELAIVAADGRPLFDSLLDPGIPIPWEATRVHGIDDDKVCGMPTLEEAWSSVRSILAGRTVVIYNASFDRGFFPDRLACAAAVECAMLRYRRLPGTAGRGNSTLTAATIRAGHAWSGAAHRALADTLALRRVWMYLDELGVPRGAS